LKLFNQYKKIGIKSDYKIWEVALTRKLNILTLIGFFNISLTLLFFYLFNYTSFFNECILVLIAAPLVVIANHFKNYIWGSYVFYFIGFILFYFLCSKMGSNTYSIFYFFPLIISLVQIFARRELLVHLFILSAFCFVTMLAVVYNYNYGYFEMEYTDKQILNLKLFNIIITFFTSSAFMLVVTLENLKQEQIIFNDVKEKEVLLSEVFHRVKNNMNIITSLLNLQKDISTSPETKNALEDSRNRVFSMALVHQKIYQNRSLNHINFKDYVTDLTDELCASFGNTIIEKELELENIELDISYAIPCGLIINELVTNSFKYARLPDRKLKIYVKLFQKADTVYLIIKDNGPGVEDFESLNKDSLGLFLVKSLSEQIDAKYMFRNNPGCELELVFKLKKLG
jgi:two-component sensor histidine kinase